MREQWGCKVMQGSPAPPVDQGARRVRTKSAALVFAIFAMGSRAAQAGSEDPSWILSYAGQSTNALIWDQRIKGVVEEYLPPSLSSSVLAGLGGPPNPVYVVGLTLSASACRAKSCPDKGFIWIDTANGAAFGATASLWGCDGRANVDLRCELILGSRRIARFENIPESGKQALIEWMNENGIRVQAVRFIDAANKTTELNPSDFRLAERFHPPSAGPSFDCQRARSQVEIAICGNPTLAKLDLDMADLYEQVHYDNVGDREQHKSLQRAWLTHRNAACPVTPDQARCLESEYQRQQSVLYNWVPTREVSKK